MSAVRVLYQQQIKLLPMIDRIQLARLIMDDFSEFVSRTTVDFNDAWSDEDLYDASRASRLYAAQMLDHENDYEDYDETG
jgi:hypothetical protein